MPGTGPTQRVIATDAESWETTYAVFTHLMLVVGSMTIPIVPALIMWLIKRNESPFVDDHGREVLNFQISLTLYVIISSALMLCGVGFVLLPLLLVGGFIAMIFGAIAAGKGEYFRYPATLRFLT